MPKFSQWIRKITQRGHSDQQGERSSHNAPPRRRLRRPRTPLIPILPTDRRALSFSYDSSASDDEWATENSFFFLRLPPEIRRMVYIALFGSRTIHMSLHYTTSIVAGKAHARLDTIKRTDNPNLQWSYTEAMPVLYHTNTFIVNDEFYDGLIFKLPNLIPAHHLRGVTSLELTSRIIPSGDAVDVGDHAALVSFICSFFPQLRCLRLHIKRGGRFIERNAHDVFPWTMPGVEGYPLVSAAIFYTTDQLVHHYSTQLKCLEVALDKYIYTRVLMVQPEEVIKTEEIHPRQSWRRFWRTVITHDGLNLGYYVIEAEDQVLIPIDTCL
ncbi:hypothetical protein MferCBS49748_002404 [Microsporum ferrugineum]